MTIVISKDLLQLISRRNLIPYSIDARTLAEQLDQIVSPTTPRDGLIIKPFNYIVHYYCN